MKEDLDLWPKKTQWSWGLLGYFLGQFEGIRIFLWSGSSRRKFRMKMEILLKFLIFLKRRSLVCTFSMDNSQRVSMRHQEVVWLGSPDFSRKSLNPELSLPQRIAFLLFLSLPRPSLFWKWAWQPLTLKILTSCLKGWRSWTVRTHLWMYMWKGLVT